MQLIANEEQRMLAESVDRFVRERYPFDRRRELAAGDPGYDEDNWATMAELGWLGIGIPEAFGGTGGGPMETLAVMRGIGRGLVLEPYLASVVLGAGLVREAGSDAQREALLGPVASGALKLAFAYAEAQSGFDLHDVETTAKREGEGFRLDGHKGVVLHASVADRIIVSARTGGESRDRAGIGLFVVDAGASGLTRRDYATQDGQRASEVSLDGVVVGRDAALGDPGGAIGAIERVAGDAIAALCAEAVGCMDASVELTNEYLKTREQFGRPIGRFQVLQHRMVDMFMAREESESMALVAAQAVLSDDAQSLSAAKALVGQRAGFVGEQSIQLHGGMGMTEEMSIGHYFKRLTMIDLMFGDHRYHLDRRAGLQAS